MQELRSDELARLLKDIAQIPSAMAFVGWSFQDWFVIDANEIRDELSFLWRRKKQDARTALQELVDAGMVIAFAPTWLHEEVAEHLLEWAEQLNIPEDQLSQIWQNYQKKYLHFIFVPVTPECAGADQLGVDPDDQLYVDLYHLISALAVVSRDSDISRMGAAQISPEVMLLLRDYARAQVYVVTIQLEAWAGLTILTGSAMLTGHLIAAVVRGFARLPFLVQLALLVGVGLVARHPHSRAVLAKGLHDGHMMWRGIMARLAPEVAKLVGTYQTKSAEAATALRSAEQALPPPRRHRLETVAFMVCLAASEPLSLEEIEERVIRAGYRSRSQQFEAYLRRVMTHSPRFTYGIDGRWSVSTMKMYPTS